MIKLILLFKIVSMYTSTKNKTDTGIDNLSDSPILNAFLYCAHNNMDISISYESEEYIVFSIQSLSSLLKQIERMCEAKRAIHPIGRVRSIKNWFPDLNIKAYWSNEPVTCSCWATHDFYKFEKIENILELLRAKLI